MPTTRIAAATRNASVKELVVPRMYPVAMGAAAPIRLLARFMRLPNDPTPPLGAISEGNEQQTGAAEASPPRAMEIHMIAQFGSEVRVAPNTASPSTCLLYTSDAADDLLC